MNLKQYLFLFTFGTIIAGTSFGIVLFFVDPIGTGLLGALLFYITLGCLLIGFFTTVGTGLRAIFYREESIEKHISRSLRQGLLFSALILTSLLLQSMDKLSLVTILPLIVFFGLLEFLFLGSKNKR